MRPLRSRPTGRDHVVSYAGLIGDFFDAQAAAGISGGFPAFDAGPAGEGVVHAGPMLEAFFCRVDVAELEPQSNRFAPLPFLWIYVTGDDHRLDSLVVEVEEILAALKMAPPGMAVHRRPMTAYVATDQTGDKVNAGAVLYLSLSVVELDQSEAHGGGSGSGIKFELSRNERDPALYSFVMKGATLLLALALATFAEPVVSERSSGLAEEMKALFEETGT